MSDLQPIQIANEKKKSIFDALNEIALIEPIQPGDVTSEEIGIRYGVTKYKARDMMKELVRLHPNRFSEVLVIVTGTYHNRPSYVLRECLPTHEDTTKEPAQPRESDQSES